MKPVKAITVLGVLLALLLPIAHGSAPVYPPIELVGSVTVLDYVYKIVWSPDGSNLIILTGKGLSMFNSAGTLIWSKELVEANDLDVSPDGKYIMVSYFDMVEVYDLYGRTVSRIKMNHINGVIVDTDWSPHEAIAIGGVIIEDVGQKPFISAYKPGGDVLWFRKLNYTDYRIQQVEWSPDKRMLAAILAPVSGDVDTFYIVVCNSSDGVILWTKRFHQNQLVIEPTISWDPRSRILTLVYYNSSGGKPPQGVIGIVNLASVDGSILWSASHVVPGASRLWASWSIDGELLAVAAIEGQTLTVYNRSGSRVWNATIDDGISDVAWSPIDDRITVTHSEGLSVYNMLGEEILTLDQSTIGSGLYLLSWSPDGSKIAVASFEGYLSNYIILIRGFDNAYGVLNLLGPAGTMIMVEDYVSTWEPVGIPESGVLRLYLKPGNHTITYTLPLPANLIGDPEALTGEVEVTLGTWRIIEVRLPLVSDILGRLEVVGPPGSMVTISWPGNSFQAEIPSSGILRLEAVAPGTYMVNVILPIPPGTIGPSDGLRETINVTIEPGSLETVELGDPRSMLATIRIAGRPGSSVVIEWGGGSGPGYTASFIIPESGRLEILAVPGAYKVSIDGVYKLVEVGPGEVIDVGQTTINTSTPIPRTEDKIDAASQQPTTSSYESVVETIQTTPQGHTGVGSNSIGGGTGSASINVITSTSSPLGMAGSTRENPFMMANTPPTQGETVTRLELDNRSNTLGYSIQGVTSGGNGSIKVKLGLIILMAVLAGSSALAYLRVVRNKRVEAMPGDTVEVGIIDKVLESRLSILAAEPPCSGAIKARLREEVAPPGYEGEWSCCKLGCGGWGCVYKCSRGEDTVVFKIARGYEEVLEGGQVPTVSERLMNKVIEQARRVKALNHRNLLRLLAYSSTAPLLVYEYADGGSIEYQIGSGWRPSLRDILVLGIQVGDALRYLHTRGLVHGDVKPGNILFKDARAKLADYSSLTNLLATMSSSVMYTPGWRAPEQVFSDLKRRSSEMALENMVDVYQLGNILLYLATGEFVDGEEALSRDKLDRALSMVEHDGLRELLGEMLRPEPWERPSSSEVVKRLLSLYREYTGEP